jgi:mono/diheme cytochrome c family protein
MERVQLRRLGALAAGTAILVTAAGCGGQAISGDDNLVAGKQMFVERCGSCHVLARAGTKGTVGPDLDAAFAQSLRDGLERSTVRSVVEQQILYPPTLEDRTTGTQMPAKLVEGEDARDVAAYVATVASRGGEDTGLLAEAVKQAGGGEPAVAEGGELEIAADPSGQLAYVTNEAQAEAGALTITSPNESQVPHNIALEGNGVNEVGEVVQGGGISEIQVNVTRGTYAFFCTVEGHREAGMEGELTVR